MLRICQRMGWTLEHWLSLNEWERLEWAAYDVFQRKQAEMMLKAVQFEETDDKGVTKHLVKDYPTYIALLRETM